MDIEKMISELKDLLVEKKFSEEAVASMTSVFSDAIKQKDEQYIADLNRAKEEKEALKKQSEELQASVEDLKAKFEESQKRLNEFEAAQKAEQAVARFNERMDVLDSKFELDDEDRAFLAQELKSLDSTEEAFASFKQKMDILWKHKDKEAKAKLQEEVEAKIKEEVDKRIASISTASDKTKSTEEILDKAQASKETVPNSNEQSSKQEETLREKFASSLKRENIIIQ